MKNMLRAECKKAYKNRYFFFTLAFASAIALVAAGLKAFKYITALEAIDTYCFGTTGTLIQNPAYSSMTAYAGWLGGDMGEFPSVLYYFLLFLLVTIPFGWSLFSEIKSGYRASAVARGGRKAYYLSKYTASFLSGGTVAAAPLLLNFLVTLCVTPATLPDAREDMYMRGVNQLFFGGDLLYTTPLLYVLLYIGIAFVFGGLWSTVPISLSFLSKNRFVVLIAPYLFLVFFHFLAGSCLPGGCIWRPR